MKIALLNSRKARRIDPDARWLRATFALAAEVARRRHVLRGSTGTFPYEAALYGAARHGGEVEVIGSTSESAEAIETLLPPGSSWNLERVPDLTPRGRDAAVIDGADLAIAVAVRAGGNMATLLWERWSAGRPVQVMVPPDGAEPDWSGNQWLLARGVPPVDPDWQRAIDGPSEDVAMPASAPGSALVIPPWDDAHPGLTLAHFTRGCHGPWPDQSRRDYLEDLRLGGHRARRDGAATLEHILETGRIFGSARLIRGGHRMVSLTALEPARVAELHRYRRHLLRWDFEPYGIVIDRDWLERLGARPVRYLPSEAFGTLSGLERPWFQKHAPPACDFQAEQEWRWQGDLDLREIPSLKLWRIG